MNGKTPLPLIACLLFVFTAALRAEDRLPGTDPLDWQGDLAARMVEGIDRDMMRLNQETAGRRAERWKYDFSSYDNYAKSVAPNRERLCKILGIVDQREKISLEIAGSVQPKAGVDTHALGLVGTTKDYRVFAVRWNVFGGIEGEGLLLQPKEEPIGNVIALPDCDWTPEMLVGLSEGVPEEAQFARRLAEQGFRVFVPTLINRQDTYSGLPGFRMSNQPHREYLWRAAYEMGRHIIGYEAQKVMALVDWLERDEDSLPTAVYGYGEGGLLAFYSAAVDERIDLAVVSGYFQPRETLWREPIYRNVWSLLTEYGDAEIVSLIAPRSLIVEHGHFPEVANQIETRDRSGAAPGKITTPELSEVKREFERAENLVKGLNPTPFMRLIENDDGLAGDENTLRLVVERMVSGRDLRSPDSLPSPITAGLDAEARQKRQFEQILEHTQHLMRESEFTRDEFWAKADRSSMDAWEKSVEDYRQYFWQEIIGQLPPATREFNPRSRFVYDEPTYRGYEVVLDVYSDVFAYGILLLPKDIQPGEKRPVVVCQHGLEGRPQDVADPKVDSPYYHRYACQLAEKGFITFAPQNPYIGEDDFRVLLRKGQPIQRTLFSYIVRQHEQILQWLKSLDSVDPERIAFYGLSYGGKTAMRVPALLPDYCLSICSADYNEWIWKNVSARHKFSYLITGEYDMPEFNLGETFNYSEMSRLIFPRPFMVERGHDDVVAPDEWVAYEYAKTRRFYVQMGQGDRTEIEFFDGPHMINGVGTFAFLEKHLKWGTDSDK